MKTFYFSAFEERQPEPALAHSPNRELLWQYLAVINLTIGAYYIFWRWTSSLNMDALWYAVPLVVAETCAYIGLVLFTFNLWRVEDTPKQAPPKALNEIVAYTPSTDRPLTVDMFFPTYDEDPELVRYSIRDAKNVNNPMGANISIHVLDDGKRDAMQKVAEDEGVNYISREGNIGFKAGNLRNAMEQTSADIIVICDADTRPFPTFLENTLGYFRDPNVAWVQTPQWFYDLPEGKTLDHYLGEKAGVVGRAFGWGVQKIIGEYRVGEDPFVNDPKMFYDVIQRRRNWCNASFCCGAGSLHRREAVMEVALKSYSRNIESLTQTELKKLKRLTGESEINPIIEDNIGANVLLEKEFTPYHFHVSEDIYTSIELHADPDRDWRSVIHPDVESKMLSPQDLLTWIIQRFKYAGGTLDIAFNDSPLTRKGLSWKQRAMYATTIWSYLGGIWNGIFLVAPLVYFYFAISPVQSYSIEFYAHILPFLVMTELAFLVGTWGIAGYPSKATYLSFFSTNLRALWTVIKGEEIKFKVTPKDRQEGTFYHLLIPQITLIVVTTAGLIYAWFNFLYVPSSHYDLSGVLLNTFWGVNNLLALSGIIFAAAWQPEEQ